VSELHDTVERNEPDFSSGVEETYVVPGRAAHLVPDFRYHNTPGAEDDHGRPEKWFEITIPSRQVVHRLDRLSDITFLDVPLDMGRVIDDCPNRTSFEVLVHLSMVDVKVNLTVWVDVDSDE